MARKSWLREYGELILAYIKQSGADEAKLRELFEQKREFLRDTIQKLTQISDQEFRNYNRYGIYGFANRDYQLQKLEAKLYSMNHEFEIALQLIGTRFKPWLDVNDISTIGLYFKGLLRELDSALGGGLLEKHRAYRARFRKPNHRNQIGT